MGEPVKATVTTDNCVAFMCPGCEHAHAVPIMGLEPVWEYNGNAAHSTLLPSIRIRSGNSVCHSFVKSGKIQFLVDSTHKLAGHAVELPEWK